MPHSQLCTTATIFMMMVFGCATPTQHHNRMVITVPVEPSRVSVSVRNNIVHLTALAETTLYEAKTVWRTSSVRLPLKKIADKVRSFVTAPKGFVYATKEGFFYRSERFRVQLPTKLPPLALCESGKHLYVWTLVVSGKRARRVLWRFDRDGGRQVIFEQEGWTVAVWIATTGKTVIAGTENLLLIVGEKGGEIIEHKGVVKGGATAGNTLYIAFLSQNKLIWRRVEPTRTAIQKAMSNSSPQQKTPAPVIVINGNNCFGVWDVSSNSMVVYYEEGRYTMGLASVRDISLDNGLVYRMVWSGGRTLIIERFIPQTR